MSASPASPLRGGCGCGAVRFEIRAPFIAAWYCHCHRCQHRTGTSCSPAARFITSSSAMSAFTTGSVTIASTRVSNAIGGASLRPVTQSAASTGRGT